MKFIANIILAVLWTLLAVLWLVGCIPLFLLGAIAKFIGGDTSWHNAKPFNFTWNFFFYKR